MLLEFFIDIFLPAALWLWVDLAPNRNEYQDYFMGVKVAGAYDCQLYHLHVPIVLKSGSVKLLELSGPVHACNGIAFASKWSLPFRYLHRNSLYAFSYLSVLITKAFREIW
jgi:hypothetical protein